MDATGYLYYEKTVMHRHLLALFALFTGLAAVQAPANASSLETMVFDARTFAGANEGGAENACMCASKREVRKPRCVVTSRTPLPPRLCDAVRPPIIFGSDRALE